MKLNIKQAVVISFLLLLILNGLGLSVHAEKKKKPKSLAEAAGLSKIPKIKSESGIIIDAESGAVLLAKNEHKKQYPASITKVMTVLLALENGNPDDVMTCSRKAVMSIERGSSHIGIQPDEKLVLKDALHGILLMSANEISNSVGEYVAGDMKSFAKMMTKRAKSLGCKNTHFMNASGLHDDKHYTTAYDMALILREAMKHELFRKIVTTRQAYIPKTNLTDEKRYLSNSNKLILKNSPYYYEKCTGGKTGFTQKAWHTLVNSADNGEIKLISAVLRSQGRPDKWKDTISGFDYCFEHFYNVKLNSDAGDKEFKALRAIKVDDKPLIKEDSALSYLQENPSVTLPKGEDFSRVKLKAKVVEDRSNERLIAVTYTYNGCVVGKCRVLEKLSAKQASDLKDDSSTDTDGVTSEKGESKSVFNKIGFWIITASVVLIIAAIILWFTVIRKKGLFEDGFFNKNGKNKFSFDKSLFKRH